MAATIGNEFWKQRTTHGTDKLFNPETLWSACCEYFQWVVDNPLLESKLVTYLGDSKIETLPKMRAMTIGGLCIFLSITQQTWCTWRKRKDLSEVVARSDEVIRCYKFTGAAAELFNPSIIAQELGLASKQTQNITTNQTIKIETPEGLNLDELLGDDG